MIKCFIVDRKTNGGEMITDGFKVLTSSGAVNDPFCLLCSLDCSSRRRDLVVDPNDLFFLKRTALRFGG